MATKEGTVNIKGKQYETVAHRVQRFRETNPTWTISTEILFRNAEEVVMVAKILDETGRLLANGHAEEQRKSSQINQTSALENCETSAIGRALAAMGMGGTEFASANEVQNAIAQQRSGAIPATTGALERVENQRLDIVIATAEGIIERMGKDDLIGAYELSMTITDADERVAMWGQIKDSKIKSTLKRHHESLKEPEIE